MPLSNRRKGAIIIFAVLGITAIGATQINMNGEDQTPTPNMSNETPTTQPTATPTVASDTPTPTEDSGEPEESTPESTETETPSSTPTEDNTCCDDSDDNGGSRDNPEVGGQATGEVTVVTGEATNTSKE